MATAHGLPGVVIGAGILIGTSLACTASAMALAVSARAVPPGIRSLVLGLITGAGSLGALASRAARAERHGRPRLAHRRPGTVGAGPRAHTVGMVRLARRPHRGACSAGRRHRRGQRNRRTVHGPRPRFVLIMAGSYFVCGMQLLFITTHLPSYLQICGMDPMLSAEALGLIRNLQRVRQRVLRLGRWPLVEAAIARPDLYDALARARMVLHRPADTDLHTAVCWR